MAFVKHQSVSAYIAAETGITVDQYHQAIFNTVRMIPQWPVAIVKRALAGANTKRPEMMRNRGLPKLPAPPGLPALEPERGKAAQVAGDVGDTVLDVVTLPAAAIRSAKLAFRGAKDRVVTSAKAGSPPPDPVDLLGDVVNSVVTDARRLLDDVEARFQRL